MIRSEWRLTVVCDRCGTGLRTDAATAAGDPTVFTDGRRAAYAMSDATRRGTWVRTLDGRWLCRACADRRTCRDHGHDYAVDGWRICACDRSIPTHADTPPDPAGGGGCAMTWRLCGRCDHIDEHPLTEHPDPDPDPRDVDDQGAAVDGAAHDGDAVDGDAVVAGFGVRPAVPSATTSPPGRFSPPTARTRPADTCPAGRPAW